MRKFLTLITAGVLLVVVPAAVAADKKDREETSVRSLQGVVRDGSDNPIEGAVVQLKDTKSLQIRSYITKANGQYQFHGLSPDIDYEVRAESRGAQSDSRRLSSFDSRRQAVLNLKIEMK
jgi:hypothetical protein